jgi:hypothetical protein
MEAYQDLDIRFLMDDEYKGNERSVDGKITAIKNLKEMPKFLTPIPF